MINQIVAYLQKTGGWAPVEFLCDKFSITPSELSTQMAEALSLVDIRIDRNIVHVN